MAKRFIDTKIWDKAWFRKLTTKNKLVWIYLLGRCDHAGIWDADWELAEFIIGESVTYDELPDVIKNKMKHIKGEDQYFIPSFIDFQYGELKEHSKPHKSVIKRLTEKNLLNGIHTIKDKDKDQLIDKVKNKESRESDFKKEVMIISKHIDKPTFEKKTLNEFILYWTESNRNGKKMKFEMQKTFDIKRRLARWVKNNEEWSFTSRSKSLDKKFPLDKTGNARLGICSKCHTTVFLAVVNPMLDSKCCNAKVIGKGE